MEKREKTNVMRLLDGAGIAYEPHYYGGGALSGAEVAQVLGEDPARVFKTLVTAGSPRAYYVFVIPATAELDLKKAAYAAGEKSIRMLPQRELLPLTGYVHGGCSPVGMKKRLPTFFDASAQACGGVYISGGKVGTQVFVSPADLQKLLPVSFCDLTAE